MNLRYPAAVASALALSLPVLLSSCGGHSRTPTVASNAAPAQQVPQESIEDSIANFLFGLAKDKAKNFIMEKLGLPTPASEMQELSKKIDALSAQLTATEGRLTTEIKELKLETRLKDLTDWGRDLDSLYKHYFEPLVSAIIGLKVAQEKTPRDQAAIDAAKADVETHKREFLERANVIGVTTIAAKIHDRLQPSVGEGVLREYGSVIMGRQRIVNFSDSQRVADLYTFLEENQALATWMSVERAIALGGSSLPTIERFLNEFFGCTPVSQSCPYFGWQKQQRNPTTTNGLLPPIPRGVAIDRGDPAPAYSTKNRPMFTLIGGTYSYPPWSQPAWPAAQVAVARANASMLRGFNGWGVPNGAQLDDLFKPLDPKTPASITAYIDDVFDHPNTPTPRPWIWVSNTTTQHYCYDTPTHKLHCTTSDSHAAKSTDTFSSEVHPRISQYGGPPPNLDRIYREAPGGLILVRNTGEAGDYL